MAVKSKPRRKPAPVQFPRLPVAIHGKDGKLSRVVEIDDPRAGFIKAFNEFGTEITAKPIKATGDVFDVYEVREFGKTLLRTPHLEEAKGFYGYWRKSHKGRCCIVKTTACMTGAPAVVVEPKPRRVPGKAVAV